MNWKLISFLLCLLNPYGGRGKNKNREEEQMPGKMPVKKATPAQIKAREAFIKMVRAKAGKK